MEGGGERRGDVEVKRVIKYQKAIKTRRRIDQPPSSPMLYLFHHVRFWHLILLYVFLSALDIKCFLFVEVFMCACSQSLGSHMCVCQVCVNRDERRRVRAWPCIIHGADLAEGSRGSSALL